MGNGADRVVVLLSLAIRLGKAIGWYSGANYGPGHRLGFNLDGSLDEFDTFSHAHKAQATLGSHILGIKANSPIGDLQTDVAWATP
jgi:hypothetical protein